MIKVQVQLNAPINLDFTFALFYLDHDVLRLFINTTPESCGRIESNDFTIAIKQKYLF